MRPDNMPKPFDPPHVEDFANTPFEQIRILNAELADQTRALADEKGKVRVLRERVERSNKAFQALAEDHHSSGLRNIILTMINQNTAALAATQPVSPETK